MNLRTLSFNDCISTDPAIRAHFVEQLGLGLEDLGFVCITEPPLDLDGLTDAYAIAASTFDLSTERKLAYEQVESGRQRGYTPLGQEHAKDHDTADLKEFWQVGRTLPSDHPLAQTNDFPPNASPTEIPPFANTFDTMFTNLEVFSDHLLAAVGSYLGLEDGLFARMTRNGSSVLRLIHYPPLPSHVEQGAVRAAAHEDINLMTVLPVSTVSGLELLTRDGEWVAVKTPLGSVIVDTGDMMALLTGNRLPATTHRVVNPTDLALANQSRYSMPFFIHPHPDWRMDPFDGRSKGPLARDFLMERLIAIGVAPASTPS